MNRMIYLPFLLVLASCALKPPVRTPEPIVVVKEVKIPVSVPCVPKEYDPARPDYADSDSALKAAVDAAERYLLLWVGREQRQARENENEKALSGCLTGGVE